MSKSSTNVSTSNGSILRVSVAMATYNGAKYIREQLDSILNQTCQPDEIVISDDSSTDETRNIIQSYLSEYPIIKLVLNKNGHGALANFKNAFNNATGDIIFPADQDDIWDSNKIERIMSEFREDIDLVYAQDVTFFEDGYEVDDIWHIGDYRSIIWRNQLKGHTCAFRRSLISLYDISSSVSWDYVLCIYACFSKRFVGLSDKLVRWRRHREAIGAWTDQIRENNNEKEKSKWSKWKYMMSELSKGHKSSAILEQMQARGIYIDKLAVTRTSIFDDAMRKCMRLASMVCIEYAKQTPWSVCKSGIYNIILYKQEIQKLKFRQKIGKMMWAFCCPAIDWYALHNEENIA